MRLFLTVLQFFSVMQLSIRNNSNDYLMIPYVLWYNNDCYPMTSIDCQHLPFQITMSCSPSVIFVIFQWLTVIFCHAIITQKSFKWFFNDSQNIFVCFFNTSYKMSRNESIFDFVREYEIYNSFDCDEIKTTKKIERKLAIHQARA